MISSVGKGMCRLLLEGLLGLSWSPLLFFKQSRLNVLRIRKYDFQAQTAYVKDLEFKIYQCSDPG